jgi:monoamine oxidase
LRQGFTFVRRDGDQQRGDRAWRDIATKLEDLIHAFRLAEQRWDGVIAREIARHSIADWLEWIDADADMRATMQGMRGFFLADPEDLSLLALVDQFSGSLTRSALYRIADGNDQIATRILEQVRARVRLRTALVRVVQEARGIVATMREPSGELANISADYLVCALPASTLRDVEIDPPLPPEQRDAIVRLRYGSATRTLLQFDRPFWRKRGRPRAFGTDRPIGAIWDGNEEQDGAAGILSLLAGGSDSAATRELMADKGIPGMLGHLDWLGPQETQLLAHWSLSWEEERWSRGGYAYFDPAYDPQLREWLPRPCGRIVFAGEHTSNRWQGYMNGAVESGRRAAAEVRALDALRRT